MWGSIAFGMFVGMAVYVATGGEHPAMMLAITAICSMLGVSLAMRFTR